MSVRCWYGTIEANIGAIWELSWFFCKFVFGTTKPPNNPISHEGQRQVLKKGWKQNIQTWRSFPSNVEVHHLFLFPRPNTSNCLMSGSLPSPEALIQKLSWIFMDFEKANSKHQRFWLLISLSTQPPKLQVRIYTPAATSVPTPGLAMGPVGPIFVALKQQISGNTLLAWKLSKVHALKLGTFQIEDMETLLFWR